MSMTPSPRSLIAIDLGAVCSNVRYLKSKLQRGTAFLAAVKADGYGHGMVPCARAAVAAGADGVAVATAEEAALLRERGFEQRILVMGPLYGADQYRELAGRSVDITILSDEMAQTVVELAAAGLQAHLHIKVDSGMNRQGLAPAEVGGFLQSLQDRPGLEVVGVMTHFACADEDAVSVEQQMKRFLPCVHAVKIAWPRALAHAANSAATMNYPQTHLDMVRCGIAVYGLSPRQGDARAEGLKPALAWTSRVVLVKRVQAGEGIGYGHTYRPEADTEVAVVPVGYADGVFRALGNRAHVLIRGRRFPLVGRVSMDSFAVDLGTASGVRVGDEVVLIGESAGQRISAEEVAKWAGTINYEVTCRISLNRACRSFAEMTGDSG